VKRERLTQIVLVIVGLCVMCLTERHTQI
jgi:hypothetical protein